MIIKKDESARAIISQLARDGVTNSRLIKHQEVSGTLTPLGKNEILLAYRPNKARPEDDLSRLDQVPTAYVATNIWRLFFMASLALDEITETGVNISTHWTSLILSGGRPDEDLYVHRDRQYATLPLLYKYRGDRNDVISVPLEALGVDTKRYIPLVNEWLKSK